MTTTFEVGRNLSVGLDRGHRTRQWPKVESKEEMNRRIKGHVEANSKHPNQILSLLGHGLFEAVHVSFSDHYPLILNPDAIWLTIAQGVATHVNQNSEKFRSLFVAHQGKKEIEVRRDGFVRGNPDNDWQGVFGEFAEKIGKEVGESNQKRFLGDFTTTGLVERAASEVVLMDAMQAYFSYTVGTLCGIPNITLEGTPELPTLQVILLNPVWLN